MSALVGVDEGDDIGGYDDAGVGGAKDGSSGEEGGEGPGQVLVGLDEVIMLKEWAERQLEELRRKGEMFPGLGIGVDEGGVRAEMGVGDNYTKKRKVTMLLEESTAVGEGEGGGTGMVYDSVMKSDTTQRELYCQWYRQGQVSILEELMAELVETLAQCCDTDEENDTVEDEENS